MIIGLAALVLCTGLIAGLTTLHFLGWFRRRDRLLKVEELCPGLPQGKDGFPVIQWLGHSSYRIEWSGRVLLVDPVLSSTVSVAPRLCDWPEEDCLAGVTDILVTHGHMDHLDNGTLERIAGCRLYLPSRTENFLSEKVRSIHTVHGFAEGDSLQAGSLRVDVVPAHHGGWRYPWQKGYFACGFVISDGTTSLYAAGDTAWGNHFSEVGDRHAPDIAILPIGGYSPRWFLKTRHLNPPEAAQAARQLGSRWVIPGHFGTYRVSLEPHEEPLTWFKTEMFSR